MGLVPDIDKDATISNVRSFFRDDKYYPRIKRRAWFAGIKSPQIDVTGIHGSRKGNSSESMMIDYAEYAQAKRAIDYAIRGCSNTKMFPSQQILQFRYVEQNNINEVKERLGRKYGHNTYIRADEQACYEFAECLDGVTTRLNVDRKIIPKMLIQKTGSKRELNGKKTGSNREVNGKRMGSDLL